MAINKKLITFAKKSVFLSQQQGIGSATTPTNGYYNNIPAHSIVFIKDTGEIWHNGKYYSGIERYLTIESGVTDGIIHRQEGVYYLSSYTLWGNTFDGSDPSINGNIYVDNKLAYTTAGIYRYANNNLEPLLYWSESGYGLTVSQGNLDVNGSITAKANGTTKFEANASTGKVTAAGDIDCLKILNTPSYIAATQTQGKKWIDIKQFESSSPYTPISLADNPPAYLTIQEGTHSADYNWKPWIADGDSTSKSSWGIGLSGDAFYIGRVAKEQTTNALTNAWIFDNEGYITSGGYKKTNSSDLYVLLGGGGHKLESSLTVQSAGKLTTPITFTIGSQSQQFDGSSNITFSLDSIGIGRSWDITYSPTSIQFSGDWVRMPMDLSSLVSGSYIICIEDGSAYYTGVFMFSTGTINTDEEILLHACGTRPKYTVDEIEKPGIIYAKIKPYSNNAAIWLAYSHQVTKSQITIKIKKLATL